MSDGSFPAADNRNEACDIMPASRSAPREYPRGKGSSIPFVRTPQSYSIPAIYHSPETALPLDIPISPGKRAGDGEPPRDADHLSTLPPDRKSVV